jgi:hypothetical protein
VTNGGWLILLIPYVIYKKIKQSGSKVLTNETSDSPQLEKRFSGNKFAQDSAKGAVFTYASLEKGDSYTAPYAIIDLETTGLDKTRNRIIEVEGICDPIIHDPSLGDWFGITDEDAFVEPHTDIVSKPYLDYNIRRYNVIISMPTEGGQPIYDGDVLDVGEKGLWMCEASLYKHASVPNQGSRMRLNISYGFYIPKNQYNAD